MIGWQARQLEGGYKTYRRATLEPLDTLPSFRYVALVGPTGSGKTRLLPRSRGGRADAGSRSARRASRLAARRMGRRGAAVAKGLRHVARERAAQIRSGAAGVRRSGEPAHRRDHAARGAARRRFIRALASKWRRAAKIASRSCCRTTRICSTIPSRSRRSCEADRFA